MNSFIHNSKKNGFTMIELIITIAILSFGIIGVYTAFNPIASLTYTIALRFNAAYLAQEGLEIVRNLRDNNFIEEVEWSEGLLICEIGCQADYKTGTSVQTPENALKAYDDNTFLSLNQDGFYGYDAGGTVTKFKRKITIHRVSGDVLKASVVVTWNYNGVPYSFDAAEYLYNWY
ncbi:MAG: hypothetical protein A3A98_00620 [Candidatus Staskawiczbacteria bacterium RIFCSPLOWO2_01_FULL_40_39]|uniref:Prepilin-type N-terminal cleavage/methylation domain-containing protein n=1 Tax=Candidatus Staskawiczbacteria bacterium RIFCSPHIGHO2_01_FULL_39_25 TaxID=1802202 RepID=A0A1G2HN10_9BACT|nr:MAG: hypothetical protein A2730_00620 [Candidatus Staskawiczbacteria bacterium RIFCSPHIGHO2_01_FULL_39_25]OGZ73237.1 MAG: hypothetical protein A3A98_00620 [Candidatus Staskawiczbacteria bacterium RIFCSPLOWO2_01_FULL_40_39]OGZ76412.1 MAG: hypothetical protein A3I87_01830 [Candidatus Staskawiczbacteria bacterium RIFCSPLOWO2_02_FULL_39_8]